jgi:hypothetical protein
VLQLAEEAGLGGGQVVGLDVVEHELDGGDEGPLAEAGQEQEQGGPRDEGGVDPQMVIEEAQESRHGQRPA